MQRVRANTAWVEGSRIGADPCRVAGCDPFLVTAEDILSQVTFSPSQIGDIARDFLDAPGKRLRPVLLHMSAALVGRPAKRLKEAAALVELLHNGTLIHDDVIDRAPMRRGRPSVNRLWGDPAGILAGDYLLAYVLDLAHRIGVPRIAGLAASILMSLVEGQWLELSHQDQCDLPLETYFEIIRKKTADLMRGACEMGGILAGGSRKEIRALGRFGEDLGMAFQITDDCLDYCGDAGLLGKEIGTDFMEGKVTLPLIAAYERASLEDRETIREAFRLRREERRFLRVLAMIRKYEGLIRAMREAESRTQRAVDALQAFSDGPVREAMEALARGLLDRVR